MNKKSIIAIAAGVSLIGGIIAGKIHRRNEKYRSQVEELDRGMDVIINIIDTMMDIQQALIERIAGDEFDELDFIDEDLENGEDYDYDV